MYKFVHETRSSARVPVLALVLYGRGVVTSSTLRVL